MESNEVIKECIEVIRNNRFNIICNNKEYYNRQVNKARLIGLEAGRLENIIHCVGNVEIPQVTEVVSIDYAQDFIVRAESVQNLNMYIGIWQIPKNRYWYITVAKVTTQYIKQNFSIDNRIIIVRIGEYRYNYFSTNEMLALPIINEIESVLYRNGIY